MRLKMIQFNAFDSPVHVPKSHPCRYAELWYLWMKQRTVSLDRHFCSKTPWLFSTTPRTTHSKVSGPRLPCDKYFRLWSCWHAIRMKLVPSIHCCCGYWQNKVWGGRRPISAGTNGYRNEQWYKKKIKEVSGLPLATFNVWHGRIDAFKWQV